MTDEPQAGHAPRRARPRDVRSPGFPSRGEPLFQGRALDALSRKVVVPYPGDDDVHGSITREERRRVEEYIGCTLEQSFSEFTMELKNAIHRMLDDINKIDQSRPARHRHGATSRKVSRRRVA